MKSFHMRHLTLGNSRGGVLVLVAIMLVLFISIAALAVDIGQLATTRNELQNVADAAALAGAAKLGSIYMDELTPAEVQDYTLDRSRIVGVIYNVAKQNKVSGYNVVILDTAEDIKIGVWVPPDVIPSLGGPSVPQPDAVYVKARRDDDNPNSPTSKITTFFAGIFDINAVAVTAEAVAALSGPSTVAEGELQLPIGLSDNIFEPQYSQTLCTDLIAFSPTPSSCAAWHNFEDSTSGDAMEDKIIGIVEGHTVEPDDCIACSTLSSGLEWMEANYDIIHNPQYPGDVVTPSYSTGVEFEFIGGQISKLLTPGAGYLLSDYDDPLLNPGNTGTVDGNTGNPQDMTAMFDYFRYRDGDENDSEWSTTIPVYEDPTEQDGDNIPDCDNANDTRKIVGFAEVSVLQTNPPPDTTLAVRVQCNLVVAEGRGGGGGYSNILGSIPSLVK